MILNDRYSELHARVRLDQQRRQWRRAMKAFSTALPTCAAPNGLAERLRRVAGESALQPPPAIECRLESTDRTFASSGASTGAAGCPLSARRASLSCRMRPRPQAVPIRGRRETLRTAPVLRGPRWRRATQGRSTFTPATAPRDVIDRDGSKGGCLRQPASPTALRLPPSTCPGCRSHRPGGCPQWRGAMRLPPSDRSRSG